MKLREMFFVLLVVFSGAVQATEFQNVNVPVGMYYEGKLIKSSNGLNLILEDGKFFSKKPTLVQMGSTEHFLTVVCGDNGELKKAGGTPIFYGVKVSASPMKGKRTLIKASLYRIPPDFKRKKAPSKGKCETVSPPNVIKRTFSDQIEVVNGSEGVFDLDDGMTLKYKVIVRES